VRDFDGVTDGVLDDVLDDVLEGDAELDGVTVRVPDFVGVKVELNEEPLDGVPV
jgi:hypothetical protein